LHFSELALKQVAFQNEVTYGAKNRIARLQAKTDYARDLRTYLSADDQLSTAHLLPLGCEGPGALRCHATALHDITQAHALVEQFERKCRGVAVGRSAARAGDSSSMDVFRIEEVNAVDNARVKYTAAFKSTHGR
jgi:hypothetical protein